MTNLTGLDLLQMEIDTASLAAEKLEKAWWATAKSNELPRQNSKAHVEYLKAQYSVNGLYTAKSIMEKAAADTTLETVKIKTSISAARKTSMYSCRNTNRHDNEDTAIMEAIKDYGTNAAIVITTMTYKVLKEEK